MTVPAPAWTASMADDASAKAWVAARAGQVVDCQAQARLPVRLLAACTGTTAPQLHNLSPTARAAVVALGLGPACGLTITPDERRFLDQMPFQPRARGGDVVVQLLPQPDRRAGFAAGTYHQWAQGLAGDTVIADLSDLDHINSVLIAWLLQLVQSAKPMPLAVRGCRPGVATQLRQLRLDHLLRIG